MNPIASKLAPGIFAWKKIAKVKVLKGKNIQVPRIIYGKHKSAVLICTGLHLEETSGPLSFLAPNKVKSILDLSKKHKISLIIYPLVNNYGLSHKLTDEEKFLRRNEEGINYNDGWGGAKKAKEVALAEADILKMLKKFEVKLALSLHEDSTCPGKGYLWINGLSDKEIRKKIYKDLRKNIDQKYLLEMKAKKVLGGTIEDRLAIVDSEDPEAFEDWMANLGVPTVLSEAPFFTSILTRRKFHLQVITSSMNAFPKQS